MRNNYYLSNALQYLEQAINATPSGLTRNKLCDANILLMEADTMNAVEQAANEKEKAK